MYVYVNVCWNCKQIVSSDQNVSCPDCHWLICECGACDPSCVGLERNKRKVLAEKEEEKRILRLRQRQKEAENEREDAVRELVRRQLVEEAKREYPIGMHVLFNGEEYRISAHGQLSDGTASVVIDPIANGKTRKFDLLVAQQNHSLVQMAAV